MPEIEIIPVGTKAELYTPYSRMFVDKIKLLGGKWDSLKKCWIVDEAAVEDAREIMRSVYGYDDNGTGETVNVLLTFTDDVYSVKEPVTIFGRTIASALSRDSGARAGEGAWFLQGAPESGGSAKNWTTIVRKGAVVKLLNLPKGMVSDDTLPDGVTMQIIGDDIDRDALTQEKERLLARIAEIDKLLG